jgi:hypothetical protein
MQQHMSPGTHTSSLARSILDSIYSNSQVSIVSSVGHDHQNCLLDPNMRRCSDAMCGFGVMCVSRGIKIDSSERNLMNTACS